MARPWVFSLFLSIFLGGIFSLSYFALGPSESNLFWPLLTVNYLFIAGISQTGIVFSAIMRISKAEWSLSFCKIGEVLTLSASPLIIVIFFLIYSLGFNHLYYWAIPGARGEAHPNLWHSKTIFFWKTVVSFLFFYLVSFVYFRENRKIEREASSADQPPAGSNILPALVLAFYVIANTNTAWDLGMALIPDWESSIFPIYYWVGNLLAGSAFLFLLSRVFKNSGEQRENGKKIRNAMGKLLLGFTLLWIYMFWSQSIRIWYGNLSHLTAPLIKRMSGSFGNMFVLMMLFVALIPFFGLIFRKIKLSPKGLAAMASLSFSGIWLNCYLIVMPEFSDGANLLTLTWTGVSLALAGITFLILSMTLFVKWFPDVKLIPQFFSRAILK